MPVHVSEDVERAVVVAEARRPDALTVDFLALLEPEVRAKVEAIESVCKEPPVDQIARVQDRQPWHDVHRGARQVVVGTHANHVGIGEFVVEKWIRVCAVPVIRGPGPASGGLSDANSRGGNGQKEAEQD